MKNIATLPIVLALVLAAPASDAKQATRGAERLAKYEALAGTAVKSVPYHDPIKWETVDDKHILLTMRPKETWLMRLSGPCLGFSHGSPVVKVSSQDGRVNVGSDRITTQGIVSCRIEEIRPVDMAAKSGAK